MNKVISLVISIACLMVAPASAQEKSSTLLSHPIAESDPMVIQDDHNGNFFLFSLSTGEFKFYRCSDGMTFAGKGIVKLNGCVIAFESIDPDHRILASVDKCAQQAKAAIEIFNYLRTRFDRESIKEYLNDSNMGDSTTECSLKVESTKP